MMNAVITFFQHYTEVPNHKKKRKIKKRHKGSKISELFLFRDDKIVFIENPKAYATLLQPMSAFIKIAK